MRATHFALITILGSLGGACVTGEEMMPPSSDLTVSVEVIARPAPSTAPTTTNEAGDLIVVPPSAMELPVAVETPSAPPSELEPLTTDFCDESLHESSVYSTKTYENLVFKYIDGTAAAADIDTIAPVRLALQTKVSDFLGVTSRAPITIAMSPNRMAAAKHGFGAGNSNASASRIDVLYYSAADSYERLSPGHELTHVISYRVDNSWHIPFLDEGLAEYFDGSGRDLHAAYVNELRAGWDAASVTRFTDWDVWGDNYGRAGSFVKFLIDRFGRAKFIEFWRATAITYSGSGYVTKLGDKVATGVELEKAIDHAAQTTFAVGFDAIRLEWEGALAKVLAAPTPAVSAADRAAIEDLIAHVDDAIARRDPVRFRATMDGFYCDWQNDDARAVIARAAVESRGKMQTTVLSAVPVGTRNFSQVAVHAVRRETRDGIESVNVVRYYVEHFPVGWRITSATSW